MAKYLFTLMLLCSTTALAANAVPVLLYHQVDDALPPSETVTSISKFKDQLTFLKSKGYVTITISQLADVVSGKLQVPEKTVAITFDDGWKDQIAASTVLVDNNMSATFYIISETISTNLDSQYVNAEDVLNLSKNHRFEIGAHTHTHFVEFVDHLDKIDQRLVVGELIMSKLLIEQVIQRPVTSLSWPYGVYTPDELKYAGMMGFTSTVTVKDTNNVVEASPMEIGRLTMDGRCSMQQFTQMLQTRKQIRCQ